MNQLSIDCWLYTKVFVYIPVIDNVSLGTVCSICSHETWSFVTTNLQNVAYSNEYWWWLRLFWNCLQGICVISKGIVCPKLVYNFPLASNVFSELRNVWCLMLLLYFSTTEGLEPTDNLSHQTNCVPKSFYLRNIINICLSFYTHTCTKFLVQTT